MKSQSAETPNRATQPMNDHPDLDDILGIAHARELGIGKA